MAATTAQFRERVAALAALRFDQAQIIDGRVTNPDAAALLLQAVQAHVCALVACLPAARVGHVRSTDAVVDVAAMTVAERFAYYKRTAPAEDLQFFLRARMSDALRRRAEAIIKPTAADLPPLYAAWRRERQADARAAGIPAIGTAAWHARYTDATPADTDQRTGDADSIQQVEALS